jgi:carotenoid cleavage dioxygenase-like enzyme
MLKGEEAMSRSYLGFTTLASETSVEELPVRGVVLTWLTGTLVRNGPAKFEVGDKKYKHWFDGLAMLHKFAFATGRVSYANRYLRSRAYEEAMAKGTISQRGFAADPCRSLFQRVASWFFPKFTDNACANIAKLADAVVALTETRVSRGSRRRALRFMFLRANDAAKSTSHSIPAITKPARSADARPLPRRQTGSQTGPVQRSTRRK